MVSNYGKGLDPEFWFGDGIGWIDRHFPPNQHKRNLYVQLYPTLPWRNPLIDPAGPSYIYPNFHWVDFVFYLFGGGGGGDACRFHYGGYNDHVTLRIPHG